MTARRNGVAGVVISAAATQVGSAFGVTIIPFVGPVGVVALRQAVAAAALLVLTRPPIRALGLRRLAPALLLGLALLVMNTTFYAALQQAELGLVVTVEFLGPLAVALAASRRPRDLALGALALAGVVALTRAGAAVPNPFGLLLALAAGAAWAAYIVLSQRAGRSLPGIVGTAVGSVVASIGSLPVLVLALVALSAADLPRVLGIGVLTGILSSALPYSIDILVLRTLPRSLFGMLQSLHPVAAAVFGLLVLGQRLDAVQVAGIAAVCLANVLVVAGTRPAAVVGGEGDGPVAAPGTAPGRRSGGARGLVDEPGVSGPRAR
jgi:inner membrane transporter RhtA